MADATCQFCVTGAYVEYESAPDVYTRIPAVTAFTRQTNRENARLTRHSDTAGGRVTTCAESAISYSFQVNGILCDDDWLYEHISEGMQATFRFHPNAASGIFYEGEAKIQLGNETYDNDAEDNQARYQFVAEITSGLTFPTFP